MLLDQFNDPEHGDQGARLSNLKNGHKATTHMKN